MNKKRPTISRLRNASGVGILLSDHREQALVQASTLACGLTPVLFSSPAEVQVYGEQNGPMLLLVTDDACLAGSLGFSSSFQLLMDFVSTRFILVHDGIESEQKEELSCSKKRRDDQHCWLWSRPLSAEVLKSEIASAGHAAKVIACKQRLILEELQRTRRIYDCMGNGVTISDASLPDHPLIYVNPAFERMTGYSFQEACGRNCRYLQNGDTDQPDLPGIRKAIREGHEFQALLRNYRKDGTPFWNELHVAPIFDEDGLLTHFVGVQNDVTERVEAALTIEFLANHDTLTGLANRVMMLERLRQALPRAIRAGTMVAVVYFDLNNFKYVNDNYGHETGDKLLQFVARQLQKNARACETIARVGGDEFVAILEDISDVGQAAGVMARMAAALNTSIEINGESFKPSASSGLAVFPTDAFTPEALLRAADANMYKAKHEFHLAI